MSSVPANLRPIVEVLGPDCAAEFLLAFGGTPVYLAETPRETSDIPRVIGVERTKALTKRLGAGNHRIPNGKPWIARHLASKGKSVLAIARILHVNEKTVRSHLQDDESRQMSLF